MPPPDAAFDRPHQDSNLEPSAPETDALSNCAMGTTSTVYRQTGEY